MNVVYLSAKKLRCKGKPFLFALFVITVAIVSSSNATRFFSLLSAFAGDRQAEKRASSTTTTETVLTVYRDADSSDNHFKPTGKMGDTGDISTNLAWDESPHSGETCIKVIYTAKGTGPKTCSYEAPCKWAGVYWQEPPDNWGDKEALRGKGLDLSMYNRLVFWARADKPCFIEFKVGGLNGMYGDTLTNPRVKNAKLTKEWKEYVIDLAGANLKHIVGGFSWTANWDTNSEGATFYLDDIRFERK